MKIPDVSTAMNSDLCLLCLVITQCSTLALLPCMHSGHCPKAESQGKYGVPFMCFPSLKDHSLPLPGIHGLGTAVSYVLFSSIVV